jgi:hypothetical protein
MNQLPHPPLYPTAAPAREPGQLRYSGKLLSYDTARAEGTLDTAAGPLAFRLDEVFEAEFYSRHIGFPTFLSGQWQADGARFLAHRIEWLYDDCDLHEALRQPGLTRAQALAALEAARAQRPAIPFELLRLKHSLSFDEESLAETQAAMRRLGIQENFPE